MDPSVTEDTPRRVASWLDIRSRRPPSPPSPSRWSTSAASRASAHTQTRRRLAPSPLVPHPWRDNGAIDPAPVAAAQKTDPHMRIGPVSYTHLTLPTIYSV